MAHKKVKMILSEEQYSYLLQVLDARISCVGAVISCIEEGVLERGATGLDLLELKNEEKQLRLIRALVIGSAVPWRGGQK